MSDRGTKIVIIAGPNGAGKTTFAREFLDMYRWRVDYRQWFDNGGDMPLLLDEGAYRSASQVGTAPSGSEKNGGRS